MLIHGTQQQQGNCVCLVHLHALVLGRRLVRKEVARDLAAGANEAHNVGVEGQLALQVHLLLEQLQRSAAQPCHTHMTRRP